MLDRRAKIARHKARRAARRSTLRNAPASGLFLKQLTHSKLTELRNVDDMAALVEEARGAEQAAREHSAAYERTRGFFTRIDGRWHPTINGHLLRIAVAVLLFVVCIVSALLHPVAGGGASLAAVALLWNPTAGSVMALFRMFPVSFYGAKDDSTTDNTTAFSTALARASAAGGGQVLVPRQSTSGKYMVQTGQLLVPSRVHIVGVGRPTLQAIGGAVYGEIFRSILGRESWSISGLILDGNQANATSILSSNNGLITIGTNNLNVRIFDNELANTAGLGISSSTYAAGNTGVINTWIYNNYIHDVIGVGTNPMFPPQAFGPVGMFLVSFKKSWIIGNRIVTTGDDNIAMTSNYADSNDFCEDCVVAFNTCDTSYSASNIVVDGGGHRVAFNRCLNASYNNNGVEPGNIRIRSTSSEPGTKHMPYDLVCMGNDIQGPMIDPTVGSCGILAECTRSQIARNIIRLHPAATQTNSIGIRIYTQSGVQAYPTPVGELVVEDNQINGGYNSIRHAPQNTGLTKVRIRRNTCLGATNHAILVGAISEDFLEVSDNFVDGAAGDGIHWTGTWTDGVCKNNTIRNCTGYGVAIPSGTQTSTRIRDNVISNCTAGDTNILISAIYGDYTRRTPRVVTVSSTLIAADAGQSVAMNAATSKAVTVPPNSSVPFPIGTEIEVIRYGTGALTITPGAGVTVDFRGPTDIAARFGRVRLTKYATDEWIADANWATRPNQLVLAQGLLSETGPRGLYASSAIVTGGTIYLMPVGVLAGDLITNVYLDVATVATAAGTTLAKVGLYDAAGNRLAVSNDLGAIFETGGMRTCPLSAPYTVLATGAVYVAFVTTNTTTLPTILRASNNSGASSAIGSGIRPYATGGTAQTDLPLSITVTTGVPQAFWAGVG